MRKNRIIGENTDIRILTLDDDSIMTLTVQSYFKTYGYIIDGENNPYKAIERIRDGNYDILLLDFLMTPICGDKVVSAIREFNSEIFILLLTGHKSMAPPIKTIRELDIQGYFEKSDRFDQLEMLVESCVKSIHQMRTIKVYRSELEAANRRLSEANEQLQNDYNDMINSMRSIVDARDIYTRGHSDRVAYLSERISTAMNRSDEDTKRVNVGGLLHDIGKIRIPDSILLKEGILTEQEFDEMRQHPLYAYNILSNAAFFKNILPAILGHHERYDGKGYPQKLKGTEICEDARIICVADSFDAMTSFRRYRNNMSVDEALEQIICGKGTQFDPDIADVSIEILKDFDKLKSSNKLDYPHLNI